MTNPFAKLDKDNKKALELGADFAPRFNEHGLIPCVSTHAQTGEVLMLGYMNDVALTKSIETGFVYYWSRSRGKLWFKGESSGMTQKIEQLLTNCDQSALVAKVTIGKAHAGGVQASCHTGHPNCFYRAINVGQLPDDGPVQMTRVQDMVFDPDVVYGDQK